MCPLFGDSTVLLMIIRFLPICEEFRRDYKVLMLLSREEVSKDERGHRRGKTIGSYVEKKAILFSIVHYVER